MGLEGYSKTECLQKRNEEDSRRGYLISQLVSDELL